MASTSTSCVQKSFKYDVFLSFRGDDTRNNFVSHLYKALEQNGIQTYMDDKTIEKGERINPQLIKSIEESRFFIIVFSKDYAGSSWCLDELFKIIECQKTTEQTAYPVFYDVEPTEVRNQSGPVGDAFAKHENEDDAGKWREALYKASKLAGWELKNTANGVESDCIEIIVDVIFKKKCSSSWSVDTKLVGMEARIEVVVSSLELDADDVRMIGVWGIGGGGKTTLAKVVFDRIFIQLDGKAFVENVRELSKSPLYGLKKLQEQILRSVLNNKNITVDSVHEGTNMMKTFLRGRKVLIVLDDVDDREQLEALAGNDWFKFGSRVIITTRDKQVMSATGMKFIDVNLLSRAEAISLLSKNAFKSDIPIEGYEELLGQVVEYADGLPLTIKVLGAMLYGQSKPEWMDTLERLRTIPLKETLEKLELSYQSLDDDYKQIFLDVACLLKGWEKDDAIIALESCGFHARNGLRVLEQRSLISISQDGYLGMHDHIEEMGRHIVRRLHPDEPERHNRLWIQKEIEDVLANNFGTHATKCMTMLARKPNFEILMKGFANMKKLIFLHLITTYSLTVFEVNLPNALRFLRCDSYPCSSLPKTFQPKNIVGLQMFGGKMVKLWKDGEEKPFLKLKFLKFEDIYSLRTLDVRVAPNLEILILVNCHCLVEVHSQVTSNLKELRIHDCSSLEKLHLPAKSPKLISLDLSTLKLMSLHLGITPNLETLRVKNCTDMVELHMPAQCPKLVDLDLSDLKLGTLHLGITPNIKAVSIKYCCHLFELQIPAECPKLVNLDVIDLKLSTLHLGITPDLETLRVKDCSDMVELHMPAQCPKLVDLDLSNLKLTTLHLGITPNIKAVSLKHCSYFVELKIPAECPKLVNLDLGYCTRFVELSEDIGQLECLKELDITGTGIRHLPQSIFSLKGLRIVGYTLALESCGFTSVTKTSYYESFCYI